MEVELVEDIELELKYCERCGGLWLRRQGSEEVYCPPCVPKMAEFAVARQRRFSPVKGRRTKMNGRGSEICAFCYEGGHA